MQPLASKKSPLLLLKLFLRHDGFWVFHFVFPRLNPLFLRQVPFSVSFIFSISKMGVLFPFQHCECTQPGSRTRCVCQWAVWTWRPGRVRKFTCCFCVPFPALSCNENDAEHLDRDQPYPSSQKTKRMRTSFKHHQLRTMKSYFAINHNPDAKDLKQLAQKTGLTKRVLQVSWARVGASVAAKS